MLLSAPLARVEEVGIPAGFKPGNQAVAVCAGSSAKKYMPTSISRGDLFIR